MDGYKTLVTDIRVILVKKFSWAKLNFILHATWNHSAELVTDNNCQSLVSLSEEALESNNKELRDIMNCF